MKRLAIFVLYDRNGTMDCYIDYLLSHMKNFFKSIVLVINGSLSEKDHIRLKQYSSHIFIRDNKGFDGGAYKDVFLKYIPRIEWSSYNEITLMNDTFYGPFYPLVDMWDRFEQVEVDFWGITRHPSRLYSDGKKMPSHIQGYFLTIRKAMLQSQEFLAFWEDMPNLNDVTDAIREFEVRFTTYFEKHGFAGKALMDMGDYSIEPKCNENPYLSYNLRLIRDKKIPFLKKKALLFQTIGFEETIDTIKYLETKKLYNVSLIWENILRISRENQFQSIFNYSKLEDFYHNYSRVFIYGAGKYGQKVKKYFVYRKWSYACFLVSREEDVGDERVKYDPAMILPSDGIVMALNPQNLKEVLSQILEKVPEEQLFLPEGLF